MMDDFNKFIPEKQFYWKSSSFMNIEIKTNIKYSKFKPLRSLSHSLKTLKYEKYYADFKESNCCIRSLSPQH